MDPELVSWPWEENEYSLPIDGSFHCQINSERENKYTHLIFKMIVSVHMLQGIYQKLVQGQWRTEKHLWIKSISVIIIHSPFNREFFLFIFS